MMVTCEQDYQLLGPQGREFAGSQSTMVQVERSSPVDTSTQLGPGRYPAAAQGPHLAVPFTDIMEKGGPDQVRASGGVTLGVASRFEPMSLVGAALSEERRNLVRLQPAGHCFPFRGVEGR